MRAPAFVEPSCEALTNGSAHRSSHLIGARRLKERESVYLAFHVHLRKRAIHPSPRLPDKPILAKCEQRHFAQQPVQRERAWVTRGCKALEGRSFHGFLKRPRKATANLHSYIKNRNRPREAKTKDFLLKTGTFAAEVWQSTKIVFPRWARNTFFRYSRLAWELIFEV